MEILKKFFKKNTKTPQQEQNKENLNLYLLKPVNNSKSVQSEYIQKGDLTQIWKEIRNLNSALLQASQQANYGQPFPIYQKSKKTLLLDLDQTLIFYHEQKGFFSRPYLVTFLRAMVSMYDIYIFTAAEEEYVSTILAKLKTQSSFIKGVLSRKNCMRVKDFKGNVFFIKNLNILGEMSLDKVILIDDNPVSYLYNQQNAIPIKPFQGLSSDRELLKLIHVLSKIHGLDDVRPYIESNFMEKNNS